MQSTPPNTWMSRGAESSTSPVKTKEYPQSTAESSSAPGSPRTSMPSSKTVTSAVRGGMFTRAMS